MPPVVYAAKNDVTRFRRLGEFDKRRSWRLQKVYNKRFKRFSSKYTYLNQNFKNC